MKLLGALKVLGSLIVLALAMTTWSCPEESGPIGWPYCETTIEYYRLEEVTPLGFSGLDLLGIVNRRPNVNIYYSYKQGQAVAKVSLWPDADQPVRFVHSVPVYPSDSTAYPDIGIVCGDRVEVDVDMTIVSDDGAFYDTWSTTLESGNSAFCLDGEDCRPGKYVDFNFGIVLADMKGNLFKDSPKVVDGEIEKLVFGGRVTGEEFTAHVSYTEQECVGSSYRIKP